MRDVREYCVLSRVYAVLCDAILPVLWQKINFWKVGLSLHEKHLIYDSDSLLGFDNNIAENTYWNLQTCSSFLKLCL